jgi:hypothetical protein
MAATLERDGNKPTLAYAEPEVTNPTFTEPKDTTVTIQEAAALKAENEALKARADKAELQFAESEKSRADAEAKVRRDAVAEFADAQVKAGKLLPKDKAGLIEFATNLDAAAELNFGEGDAATKTTPLAWFKGFVAGGKQVVEFGEIATGDGGDVKPADPGMTNRVVAVAKANGLAVK